MRIPATRSTGGCCPAPSQSSQFLLRLVSPASRMLHPSLRCKLAWTHAEQVAWLSSNRRAYGNKKQGVCGIGASSERDADWRMAFAWPARAVSLLQCHHPLPGAMLFPDASLHQLPPMKGQWPLATNQPECPSRSWAAITWLTLLLVAPLAATSASAPCSASGETRGRLIRHTTWTTQWQTGLLHEQAASIADGGSGSGCLAHRSPSTTAVQDCQRVVLSPTLWQLPMYMQALCPANGKRAANRAPLRCASCLDFLVQQLGEHVLGDGVIVSDLGAVCIPGLARGRRRTEGMGQLVSFSGNGSVSNVHRRAASSSNYRW